METIQRIPVRAIDSSRWRALILPGLWMAVLPSLHAREPIQQIPVSLDDESNVVVIESKIQGYQTVDYVVPADAQQYVNVSLATQHDATYFNILAPGETDVAVFNGSIHENQFEGILQKSGDYTLRIYMMRSAARRNEQADFRLEIILGDQPIQPETDAKVSGTEYHATGTIDCVMHHEQALGRCPFGVAREGGGAALVTVTKPDGRKRVIFFDQGRAIGYDMSQADRGGFQAGYVGDLHMIEIGDERYEISDAVIHGG